MNAVCEVCGRSSATISSFLGICRDCILRGEGKEKIAEAHRKSKARFDLPLEIPSKGKSCGQCVNLCKIPDGERGYCGIRVNTNGKVCSLVEGAIAEWYYDPLPTNCVATFVCPGGTGAGYPEYAHTKGPEYGYRNLAVFYGACSYDCLFCQNWTYRSLTRNQKPIISEQDLASKVDSKTSCICYFGGDPTPQIDHAIRTSRIAMDRDAITRICFESNGSMSRRFLREIADLSYRSGGCIKFDLKTWNEELNIALCGTSNKNTLGNLEWLLDYENEMGKRGFPLVIASTLMIPGYVDADEVSKIASFLAELDPDIPYSLLAFYGAYEMMDIPTTSRKIADECYSIARECGLSKVHIGNIHLLW